MKYCLLNLLLFMMIFNLKANVPTIGAQIWIEQGQSQTDIDGWFKMLADLNMPITRLFIMWDVVELEKDNWDFTLYDWAFDAADKYGIKVVATLSPTHAPIFRGGAPATQYDEMPATWAMLEQQKIYIEKIVRHYKDFPALYAWMPQNEPGRAHNTGQITMDRFRDWLKAKYGSTEKLNVSWHHAFANFESIEYDPQWEEYGWGYPETWYDWREFGQEHLTWYMQWIINEVRRYDQKTPMHLNPHGLVGNLIYANYKLHEWRRMLNSLGASIHVGWHFGMLDRIQYTMGVSYVCDLIRGASEPNPFWVTELQGGNNIYSAVRPHCPTPEDVEQWVWTSIGAGADNVIFWLLNWRSRGNEAGEWSMLNFQGQPTERLLQAGKIAKVVNENQSFFANAKPALPNVTIIYSYKTMMQQARTRRNYSGVGRDANAHIMSVLGYYKALQDLGICARLKEIDDFDWTDQKDHFAIVPHITMLTKDQASAMKTFAEKNKLLVSGLTGFYDEHERAMPATDFPLAAVFGATIKEIKVTGFDRADLQIDQYVLPAHIWNTTILDQGAEVLGKSNNDILAVQHDNAVWLPSTIGLGAWLYDSQPLSQFLQTMIEPYCGEMPIMNQPHENVTIRWMRSDDRLLGIFCNRNDKAVTLQFDVPSGIPKLIFGRHALDSLQSGTLVLNANETIVLMWHQ